MNVEKVEDLINQMEIHLKNYGLWSNKRPSNKAFRSTAPFFMDTMEFHEWLQFVLIERFREIIAKNGQLPQKMCLYPYAIEVYKEEKFKRKELIKVIYQLDKYFEN
jgi:uncharacterized protein YqcC (DUF446 family)